MGARSEDTMRAAILERAGDPPVLGERDEPSAGPGESVVEVLAAGVNPVDLQLAARAAPEQLPRVPGREAVGKTSDGRRVYFERATEPHGSFAERTVATTDELIPVADDVDDATAVAFGIAGLAGWVSVEWRGQLGPGETVLVLGASGAVGQIAVQAARLLGAGRVVAAARSAEGLERARDLGADATVVIGAADDLTAAIRDAAGGDVDLIVDPLWGPPAAAALRAAGVGTRLVQIGEAAGAEAPITAGPLRMAEARVLGYANARAPFEIKRATHQRMLAHAVRGELRLRVERSALDDVADVWQRQPAARGVKHVLVP